jgi:hypothetical protein
LQKDVQRALRKHDVLIAVTRQAAVNRNETASGITAAEPGEKISAAPANWLKGA